MYITEKNIEAEINYYKSIIEKFERELLLLPLGSLTIKNINGKGYIYHQTYKAIDGRSKKNNSINKESINNKEVISKYLSKNDLELMEKIKRRRFIQKSLPDLKKNLKILEHMNSKFRPYNPEEVRKKLSIVYSDIEIKEFLPKEKQVIIDWLQLEEEKSDFFVENLKHITTSGKIVRSKSEAIIADLLDSNEIIYKYEAKVSIGTKYYYPDFTILRPADGKIIYWEHFGLTNNEEYSRAMFSKLDDFETAGILPWDNLIISADSKEGCIDAQRINNMIKAFLL